MMHKSLWVLCLLTILVAVSCDEKEFEYSDSIYSFVEPSEMALVPGGAFAMGSDRSDGLDLIEGTVDEGFSDEWPKRTVDLGDFYIDRTEVTNAQYRACVRDDRCIDPIESYSTTRDAYYLDPDYDDYPVTGVAHWQAEQYCAWAGKQLPTEAQWEKAARGVDERVYPWGNTRPDCATANYSRVVTERTADGEIEFSQSCRGDTVRATQYANFRSTYGAYNMAGNVSEWVSDWYDPDYYDPVRFPDNRDNPKGPKEGVHRVYRGGSFADNAYLIRTAARMHANPESGFANVGFRCAKGHSE